MPRSRSQSPREEERRRSRSPMLRQKDSERDRPRKQHGGFRWKDNRRDDSSRIGDDDRRLERGYRDRGERPRSPRRDKYQGDDRDRRRGDDKYGRTPQHDRERKRQEGHERKPKERKPVAQPAEFIVVHVNDRLGTKAAIPCLPSDPIKLFKAQVAARIGREPHEILLKRQGERPFKDALTLEDYSISNGSQLDLEVDTGD